MTMMAIFTVRQLNFYNTKINNTTLEYTVWSYAK